MVKIKFKMDQRPTWPDIVWDPDTTITVNDQIVGRITYDQSWGQYFIFLRVHSVADAPTLCEWQRMRTAHETRKIAMGYFKEHFRAISRNFDLYLEMMENE